LDYCLKIEKKQSLLIVGFAKRNNLNYLVGGTEEPGGDLHELKKQKSIEMIKLHVFIAVMMLCNGIHAQECPNPSGIPEGFMVLFNGRDFTHWEVPEEDNGHWRVVEGVIDYDAESEADDKNLWSESEYGDFILYVDWRIKATPYKNPRVPIILPDGSHKLDEHGEEIRMVVPDTDSGIYLRGSSKSQVNIWCWPIGSGEVYGYRMDRSLPIHIRRGVTPRLNADNHIGEWNTFRIEVRGDKLTVDLNGQRIIESAELPGLPESGRIALQHHGAKRDGVWVSPPSLVQFRNIFIKEL
jgi:hypothetical protein